MRTVIALLACVALCGCGKNSPFGPSEKNDPDIPKIGSTQGDMGDVTIGIVRGNGNVTITGDQTTTPAE